MFIRYWPEIWKLEIHPSEFCPISGDWDKLGMTNSTETVLKKRNLMLQKCRVYSLYCFRGIKGKPSVGKNTHLPPRLKIVWILNDTSLASHNPLRSWKNVLERIWKVICHMVKRLEIKDYIMLIIEKQQEYQHYP